MTFLEAIGVMVDRIDWERSYALRLDPERYLDGLDAIAVLLIAYARRLP